MARRNTKFNKLFKAPSASSKPEKKYRKGQKVHKCGFAKCRKFVPLSKDYCDPCQAVVDSRRRASVSILAEAEMRSTIGKRSPHSPRGPIRLMNGGGLRTKR